MPQPSAPGTQRLDRGDAEIVLKEGAEVTLMTLLNFGEKFRQAPTIHKILEARFLAISAITVFTKYAQDGGRHGYGFARLQDQADIAGELLVTRNTAELDAEMNS